MLAKEGALQSEPASAGSLQSGPASAGSLQSEPASAGGSPTKYFDGCQGRRYNLQGYMSLSWPPDVRSSRKARDLDPAPQPTYASTPSSSGLRSALSPSRPPAPYRSARGCPRRARTCRGGRGSKPPASMASVAVRRAAVDPAAKAAGPMLRLAGGAQRSALVLCPNLGRHAIRREAHPSLPVGLPNLRERLAEVAGIPAAVYARPA